MKKLITLIISMTGLTCFATQPADTVSYTTVQKPSMMVVGIACQTSPEAASHDIPLLWQQFCTQHVVDQIPNKASDEVVGLYCDYHGDRTQPYTLVIGCPTTSLDTIPAGMVGKTVPASTFAVFCAVGEQPASVISMWSTIWQTPLKRTYTGDYELYGDRFLKKTPQEVDIFIAIE